MCNLLQREGGKAGRRETEREGEKGKGEGERERENWLSSDGVLHIIMEGRVIQAALRAHSERDVCS